MSLLLVVIVVLLLLGGGFGHYSNHPNYGNGSIGLGTILLIVLIAMLLQGRF